MHQGELWPRERGVEREPLVKCFLHIDDLVLTENREKLISILIQVLKEGVGEYRGKGRKESPEELREEFFTWEIRETARFLWELIRDEKEERIWYFIR